MRTQRTSIPMGIILMVFIFFSADQVSSSNLDQELKAATVINQMAQAEQSLALALRHKTEALAQILKVLYQTISFSQELKQDITELSRSLSEDIGKQSHTFELALKNLSEKIIENLEQDPGEKCLAIKKDCLTPEGNFTNGDTWSSGCIVYKCENGSSSVIGDFGRQEFRTVSDGCFLPVKTGKNWEAAKQHCEDLGAELAFPPSNVIEFQEFLRETLSGGDPQVWMGGKRHEDDQQFHFLRDGSVVGAEQWASGEPDSSDCLCLNKSEDPPLHDCICGASIYFVCEIYKSGVY